MSDTDGESSDLLTDAIDHCDIVIKGDATSEQITAVTKAFPGRTIGVRGVMILKGEPSAAFLLKDKVDG